MVLARRPVSLLVLLAVLSLAMARPAWPSQNDTAFAGGAVSTTGAVRLEIGTGATRRHCAGVQISPDIVLTAAHCLIDARAVSASQPGASQPGASQPGASPPATLPARAEGLRFALHPQARDPVLGFDLALIRLDKALPGPPARFGDAGALPAGAPLLAVAQAEGSPPGLVTAMAAMIGRRDGNRHVRVAGQANLQWCRGDSGSPVFSGEGAARGLIGIVSHGYDLAALEGGRAGACSPIVHLVDPAQHRDWIEATTRLLRGAR
jgi:hypothetical protein